MHVCTHARARTHTHIDIHWIITSDVSDYINLLVRIAHIICNHPFIYIHVFLSVLLVLDGLCVTLCSISNT
jgi:hypothetical protein